MLLGLDLGKEMVVYLYMYILYLNTSIFTTETLDECIRHFEGMMDSYRIQLSICFRPNLPLVDPV